MNTSLNAQIIWRIENGKVVAELSPVIEALSEFQPDSHAAFIVKAVNAHEKLLEAVKMVFEAADEASSQELGQNIDWDMLRDAYNIGLKGEA
jgi:hypothetical protein